MGVKEKCIRSASAAETHALAAAIAARMPAGTVIAAQGDLGMGKTVFAAGLAAGLGVSDTVTSPTYIFFNEYQGRLPFCHIDAYRLEGLTEEEISLTGIADCFRREKTAFVEWPDFITAFLPPDTIWLRILPGDAPELRLLTFSYSDQTGGWLDAAFGD